MKLPLIGLSLLITTLCSTAVAIEKKLAPDPILSSGWSIGIDIANYNYKETYANTGAQLMRLNAPMYGLNFSYHKPLAYEYVHFWDFNYRILFGTEDYDGYLQNYDTGKLTPYKQKDSSRAGLAEWSVTAGHHWNNQVDIYAGLGVRAKADSPKSSDPYGYPRTSSYLYFPIGLVWKGHYRGIDYRPFIEYDYFLMGVQTSDHDYYSNRFEQDSGYGLKVGVSVLVDNFEVKPYLNYWKIEDSSRDAQSLRNGQTVYFYEPQNQTIELGLKINYRF